MLDHHEGLIYLVHEAMQRPISQKAHGVLDGFDVTEDAEKREMSEVLRSYQMASAFVVSHHRRGIKLVDAFLPQIRRPRVRELALASKRKEQREIAFHQRRLATH